MFTRDKSSVELINHSLQKIVHQVTLPIAIRVMADILRGYYPQKSFDDCYDLLFFKTNPSLAFPKSDIEQIRLELSDGEIHIEVTLNFLSIFGASSPLPMHYSERVLDDAQNERVLLDFLDMLNHRLKRLIYPIWVKQRYYMQYRNDLKDNFSKYILSVLGLYDQVMHRTTELDLHKILPFSALLSMHQKSTVTLLSILKHYFDYEAIEIQEAILSRAQIPTSQYVRLGDDNCSLGEDMCIGTFVLTRNLKFRIRFREVSWEMLESFAPGGEKILSLRSVMKLVQKDPLPYDLAVTIRPEEIRPCILGKESRLGVNSWVGKVSELQEITVSAE